MSRLVDGPAASLQGFLARHILAEQPVSLLTVAGAQARQAPTLMGIQAWLGLGWG